MNQKALILVDMQKDFLPGGKFAIPYGDLILPTVDKLMSLPFDYILASKDWHPKDHISFAENHNKNVGEIITHEHVEQILWPVHCVQDTPGAEFSEGFDSSRIKKSFLKGIDKHIDSYSAFFDNQHKKSTGLSEYLTKHNITDLYIAGLATDYCVKYSVLDALVFGFNVYIIVEACHGINLKPKDSEQALSEMKKAGAVLTTFKKVAKTLSSKE